MSSASGTCTACASSFAGNVANGVTWVMNTDDGSITSCPGQAVRPANAPASDPIQFDVVPAVAGGRAIAVFSLDSLTVRPGGRIVGLGTRALAIQARGDVVVNGAIVVAGGPAACSVAAACGTAFGAYTCAGPGGGAGIPVTIGLQGPGTGSGTCGGGFAGGGGNCSAHVYPVPPDGLIGGSGGGEGGMSGEQVAGGGGGGALQISSQTRIDVGGAQGILASGMGGSGSLNSWFSTLASGAGGGAGGLVVLDAPTVQVNAFLLANGGGGGGAGNDGWDAPVPSFRTTREPGGASSDSPGGPGGGFGTVNGSDGGPFVPMGGCGGGGGSAGNLRIFAAPDGYSLGNAAVVSPTPTVGTAVIQ
jgi:hypothetical protein